MLTAKGLEGVKVKTVLEASWVMAPVTPGDTIKVVVLTAARFMASLKVAVTTELEQTPVTAFGGVTEITVGGVRPGTLLWSGSPHPAAKMSARKAMDQISRVFGLLTSLAFPCYITATFWRLWEWVLLSVPHNRHEISAIARMGRTIGPWEFLNGKTTIYTGISGRVGILLNEGIGCGVKRRISDDEMTWHLRSYCSAGSNIVSGFPHVHCRNLGGSPV